VNFITKDTIEEGMLSALAFKSSLSAGILDGGTGEISLVRGLADAFSAIAESLRKAAR
jgi:SNF2 family DNA or RNA helicase